MVEVRIEGRRLDVFEKFDFSFNYGIADIREPDKRSTEYSKTIQCPSTPANDELFGHIYDVNISNQFNANSTNIGVNFNPNKKAEARVIADGVEVMAGVMQLRQITMKRGAYIYEVVFIGKLVNIFSVLGDKELNGLDDNGSPYIDFSDLNHSYSYSSISNSWSFGLDYVYPMLDYGDAFEYNSNGERIYHPTHFKPFIKLKSVIDRMFAFAGFTYTSQFMAGSLFNRLIIGEPKELTLSDAEANLRNALVYIGGNYDLLDSANVLVNNDGSYRHRFPYTSIAYDNGNNFNTALAIYITPYESIATVSSVVNYTITRTKRSFFSWSVAGGSYYIYRYEILPNGNCDVYNHTTGALIQSNASTNQELTNLTGDGDAGILQQTLQTIINAVTTNESYRDQIATRFTGFDCLYGSISAPVLKHNIKRYSNTYINEGAADFVFYPSITLGQTVQQTSSVTVEDMHIYPSDYVYTELVIPKPFTSTGFYGGDNVLFDVFLDEYEMIPSGTFKVEANTSTLLEHQMMDFNAVVPNVKMADLLTSVFNMFNLYVEVDPNNERNLLIETRDYFYRQGGIKDWTYKLARDKDITIQPLGLITDREYIYTYSEDGDYYNDKYQSNRGHAYGRARIEVDNDFIQSSNEVEVVFSPTPLVNDKPSSRIIGAIYDADITDGIKPTDSNVRIMQWGGMLPSTPQWEFKHLPPPPLNFLGGLITTPQSTYPYAGHWDNPINPTIDINFGLPYELYYQSNGYTGTITVTNANLFNLFHRNYINEVTDKDSKVMTAMFYLQPTDINTLNFRDEIVIDNAYWRLNKVSNYNPFKEGLTKVELIKIKEAVTFGKQSRPLNSGGTIGGEVMPRPDIGIYTNRNRYPLFRGTVNGSDNLVAESATAFKVIGNGNIIGQGTRNVTIFGNGNEVAGGLHNVQLINTNGVTVTKSNVTYVSGKQQDNTEVIEGGLNEVRALNGGTNIFTVDGGEDIVQAQFSDTAIYVIEGN